MPASWFASWRCYMKVSKGCSRYIHINTHTQHDTHIWEMLIVLFPLSPFFRGRLRRLPTSGLPYERPRATRALRWGAPPTADPPTPGPEKHQKSFRRVGESFLAGIRVAHKRLQEQAPPPFWGYLKSEKSAVLTHFSDDFSLFVTKCCTAFLRFDVFCGSNEKKQKML